MFCVYPSLFAMMMNTLLFPLTIVANSGYRDSQFIMLMENLVAIGVLRNAVVCSTQPKRTVKTAFTINSPSFILRNHCIAPNFWRSSLPLFLWKEIARYRTK
jgi:hypothetical protein